MSDIAVTGLSIQLSTDYPHNILMHIGLDKDFSESDANKAVDLLTNVIDHVRERDALKKRLASLREQQEKNRRRVSTNQSDRELEELKDKFDLELDTMRNARNAFDRQVTESWSSSARRGERKLNPRQQKAINDYDTAIAGKMLELNEQVKLNREMKRQVELSIPLTDWQIDCLFAQLTGYPEPPMPEEVAENLKQLEMPEDVSIPGNLAFAPIAA